LALASGAVAMPQTSNADIVFVDLSSNPVHVGNASSHDYVINTLPGTAQIGFHARSQATINTSSRWIVGGQDAGYVRLLTEQVGAAVFILVRANPGQTWNQVKNQAGVNVFQHGSVGFNNFSSAYPGGFSGKYYM